MVVELVGVVIRYFDPDNGFASGGGERCLTDANVALQVQDFVIAIAPVFDLVGLN